MTPSSLNAEGIDGLYDRPRSGRPRRLTAEQEAAVKAAVLAGPDDAFALVMPEANTGTMQEFLDRFSKTTPKDEVAVMYADQAGWHGAKELRVPDNVTLLALPAYSPELNPVERVWLYLKERYLSHRLHDDYEAIVDAAFAAWNKLTAEAGRITSLCSYPWLEKMIAATAETWLGWYDTPEKALGAGLKTPLIPWRIGALRGQARSIAPYRPLAPLGIEETGVSDGHLAAQRCRNLVGLWHELGVRCDAAVR